MSTRLDPRGPLAFGVLALVATTYVALVDPNHPGHYLTCPLLTLTGLYCPACGALRAMHDLAHLDVVGAWAMNPLLVAALPLLLASWARWVRRSAGGGRPPTLRSSRRSAWLAWTVLAVVLAFGVLRNVPGLAQWLAP